MKLTEEMVASITDIDKLRHLLNGLIQKANQSSKLRKQLQHQLSVAKSSASKLSMQVRLQEKELNKYRSLYGYQKIEQIRGDFNEYAFNVVFQAINIPDFQANQDVIKKLDSFKEDLKKVSQDQQQNFASQLDAKDDTISALETQIQNLQNELYILKSSPIPKDLEKLINEKDESIDKLKSLFQRAVESDKRKQQQINQLQFEIQTLNDARSSRPTNNPPHESIEEITKLENKISELEKALSNSSASFELIQKNQQLQKMIEKSNNLYSHLNDKYQDLLFGSSIKQRLTVSQAFEYNISLKRSLKDKRVQKALHKIDITMSSLRKTLLQFFLMNENDQANLIPVILELIGCNQEQIDASLYAFEQKQQLINRLFS